MDPNIPRREGHSMWGKFFLAWRREGGESSKPNRVLKITCVELAKGKDKKKLILNSKRTVKRQDHQVIKKKKPRVI